MNNYRTAILLVIIFVIALAGAYTIYRNQTNKSLVPTLGESLSPEALATISPSASPLANLQNPPPAEQPSSGSDTVEVKNIGIKVENPHASTVVSPPLTVSGSANVFEGNVIVNVKDASGKILGSGRATACMGYDACPFEVKIDFQKSTSSAGIIEVYSPSGLDGSPQYLQQILVRF